LNRNEITPTRINWSELVPRQEWDEYIDLIHLIKQAGIPFALGGGLAFSEYSGRARNTKDIDFFVLPEHHEQVVEMVGQTGFRDLYEKEPYDRAWIYRGYKEDLIVDIIWAMANQRTDVDEGWHQGGHTIQIHGEPVMLLPVEELVWSKLYVLQRQRTDWPDLLNILYEQAGDLDWERMLARVEQDAQLLGGVMNVFKWLCPACAAALPSWIWAKMGLAEPQPAPGAQEVDCHRVHLLDSRDWFGPTGEPAC
jgi:hypothetical protein